MNQPDLLQQDEANRQHALALESFIVEAPAGAGKTELLTQRYLKLLAVVSEPEEIVAITFTNKAAAEMRSRILDSLQRAENGEIPDAPHKKITFDLAQKALARSAENQWNLLEQPARLRINTIDSLCGFLARQLPLMSRFGGQPGVVDDVAGHCQEAVRRALMALETEAGEGAVTTALRYLDNDTGRLSNLLAEMLAKRDQWLHHAVKPQDEIEATFKALVQADIEAAAALLSPALQHQLMPAARFAASNLPCDHPLALLLDWETALPVKPEALALWRSVCDLLLTKDDFRKTMDKRHGFPADDTGRSHKQRVLDVIAALPSPQPLAQIRNLPDPQSEEERRIVAAFAEVLKQAAAHLLVVFQEAGEVDFVEIASRALLALEDEAGATDLALKLDYRIQHLLVDEFQDTSPAQVELLRRLTQGWQPGDGRTLFCVGDPMQSIYRFRKADVGLFLQVAEFGIGGLPLTKLHLTRNNRSSPEVVDWVNAAFEKVFPTQDDERRGAIRYRPFAAGRSAQINAGVIVHPLLLPQESLSDDMAAEEAAYLAELIVQERALNPQATIAVLVRARAHLVALVAEIRRHWKDREDLRFQAVEIEQLGGRQTVQDVLSLTRALLHRADRVHWLAILRAPWCGLMLEDLHALAADDHHANIWQLMQDEARVATLSADGQRRLRHVREVIAEAYAHQGRQPLRRWVQSVWLKLGGASCLWEAGDVRDVEAFLDLLERVEAGQDMAQLETALEKLYAAPDVLASDHLQFMTIHKSKGLEFDTVILPGLHRPSKNNDAQLLLWEEVAIDGAPPHLVAAPYVPKHKRGDVPSAYDYLQGLEKERSANELARVLYVAATRSKQRLHLVAAVKQVAKPDSKGDIKAQGNTLLSLLWHTVGGEFMNAVPRVSALPVGEEVNAAEFIPSLIRVPQPAVPPLLHTHTSAAVSVAFEDAAPDQVFASIDASCGTLAHRYMEMFAQEGVQHWSPQRVQELETAMMRWLAQHGHEPAATQSGAKRVIAALLTTLQSEQGRWVLQARNVAASEFAITTAEGERMANHVIDRTFVEAGERWIIDYKLAQTDDAELYRPQLERYAKLFKDAGLPVRKAVLFLSSGNLVEIF